MKSICDFNIGVARNILLGLVQPHGGAAAVWGELSLLIREEYRQRKSTVCGGVHIYMLTSLVSTQCHSRGNLIKLKG